MGAGKLRGFVARINFEDNVEAQPEFWKLLRLLNGNRREAIGLLVLFFRIAQKAWAYDEPMTEDELRSNDMAEVIESGWAVPIEGGYQALGAAKHFDWYRQKVTAGRRGGRPLDNRTVNAANRTVIENENRSVNERIPNGNRTGAVREPGRDSANPLSPAPVPAPALKTKILNLQLSKLSRAAEQSVVDKSVDKRDNFSEIVARELEQAGGFGIALDANTVDPTLAESDKRYTDKSSPSVVQGDSHDKWIPDFEWLITDYPKLRDRWAGINLAKKITRNKEQAEKLEEHIRSYLQENQETPPEKLKTLAVLVREQNKWEMRP